MIRTKVERRLGAHPVRRLKIALVAVIVGMLGLGLAACGGDDDGNGNGNGDAAADTDEPIVIGFASAMTGPNNAFDGPIYEGAKIAADDINAEGGVDGRQIEIIEADNRSDPDQLGPAALRAIEDGADVVHTSCDFDFGSPAARAANDQGVFAIGCAGSPLYGREGIGELTYNTHATTPVKGAAMAEYAYNELGYQSAFVLEDTSIQFSQDLCRYFNERWEELGGEVVGTETFQNDDPSIRPQVNQLRGTQGVDFVALCTYPPGGATAVRQIRAEVDDPIVSSIAMDVTGPLIEAVPDLSDFYNVSLGSLEGDDDHPGRTELGEKYEEATGEEPPTAFGPLLGYTAVELIAYAIEQTGSTDGEELAEAFSQFDGVETISGPISYTEECNLDRTRQVAMSEVQDGDRSFLGPYQPESVPEAPC